MTDAEHFEILELMKPALLKCAASGSGWHRLEVTFRNDSEALNVLDFKVVADAEAVKAANP
jgi:hypothetical protein